MASVENEKRKIYLQEESIRLLHDVGFVNGRNTLPAMYLGVMESISCYSQTSRSGDDLDAFYHPAHHLRKDTVSTSHIIINKEETKSR